MITIDSEVRWLAYILTGVMVALLLMLIGAWINHTIEVAKRPELTIEMCNEAHMVNVMEALLTNNSSTHYKIWIENKLEVVE